MNHNYFVIVKHDTNHQIITITCPTLFNQDPIYSHLETDQQTKPWEGQGITPFIQGKLLERLHFLKTHHYVIPLPEEIKNSDEQLDPTELAMNITLSFNADKGTFQVIFPMLAIAIRALSSISYGCTSILALELATGSDSKATSQIFPIAAAIFAAVMAFIMFAYSDTIYHAKESGRKMDDYFFRQPIESLSTLPIGNADRRNPNWRMIDISPYLLFAGLTMGDVSCTTVVVYQTILSLGRLVLQQGNALIPKDAILPMAVIMTIINSTSLALFEAGFAIAAGKSLAEKIKTLYPAVQRENHSQLLFQHDNVTPQDFNDRPPNHFQMKYSYLVIVKYDANQQINMITCPTLFNEDPIYNQLETRHLTPQPTHPWEAQGIKRFIQDKLLERLNFLKNGHYQIPRSEQNQSLEDPLDDTDLAMTITVDFNPHERKFEIIFPMLAISIGALSSLNYGLTSILAFELATSSSVQAISRIMPIAAAVFSTIMAFVLFIYSDALYHARESGRKMDDYFFRKPIKKPSAVTELIANTTIDLKKTTCNITELSPYLLFIGLAIGDVSCTAAVVYQTTISLGRLAAQNKDTLIPKHALLPIALTLTIINALSLALFESSFALAAGKHWADKIKTYRAVEKKNNSWMQLQQDDTAEHFNDDQLNHQLLMLPKAQVELKTFSPV